MNATQYWTVGSALASRPGRREISPALSGSAEYLANRAPAEEVAGGASPFLTAR